MATDGNDSKWDFPDTALHEARASAPKASIFDAFPHPFGDGVPYILIQTAQNPGVPILYELDDFEVFLAMIRRILLENQ